MPEIRKRAYRRGFKEAGLDVKVCIIGHPADRDEGVRSVSTHLAVGLTDDGVVVKTADISSRGIIGEIRSFRPDIVHFVLSPTTVGLLSAKFLSATSPGSISVVSALHPSLIDSKLLGFLKPNLVLAQSNRSAMLLRKLGFDVRILTNGADVGRFRPFDEESKKNLRELYEIDKEALVVLHVGPLKDERNLGILAEVQRLEGIQVVIVGRERERFDSRLIRRLENEGCVVWMKHLARIEDVYNASDCYVFPTTNRKACIETPLSVLEAMACNLVVISTRFGALFEMFEEGEGLTFVSRPEDIPDFLRSSRNLFRWTTTREKVMAYSWKKIVKKLRTYYDELLC